MIRDRIVLGIVVALALLAVALTASLPERSKAAHLLYERF